MAKKKPGRTSNDQIIIFDATGTAVQDAAAAVAVHKKAWDLGEGIVIDAFVRVLAPSSRVLSILN